MSYLQKYKGVFYYLSYSEFENAVASIEEKDNNLTHKEDCPLNVQDFLLDFDNLKLSINVENFFSASSYYGAERLFRTMAKYASRGQIKMSYDRDTSQIIHSNRNINFDIHTPTVLIFSLSEFEEPKKSLEEFKISDLIFNCPFYIYDTCLNGKNDLVFKNEKEIDSQNLKTGFAVVNEICSKFVAKSRKKLFHSLFEKVYNEKKSLYQIRPVCGFAPGYSMKEAVMEAKKQNFRVYRWHEYWGTTFASKNTL